MSPQALKRAQVERLYQKEQHRREQSQRREDERRQLEEHSGDHRQEYKLVRGDDGYLYRIPVRRHSQRRSRPERPTSRPIVRGSDGRFYRAVDGDGERERSRIEETPHSMRHKEAIVEEPQYQIVRGPDGRLYKVPIRQSEPSDTDHSGDNEKQESSLNDTVQFVNRSASGSRKKRPSRRKVTVIVEDASDSENEDESKSYWRNRRPSPGLLMEPVEDYSF